MQTEFAPWFMRFDRRVFDPPMIAKSCHYRDSEKCLALRLGAPMRGACLLYAAHSHLAGPRGRLPTVSAQANCDCPSLAPVRNLVISSRAHHYCRQRFAPSAYPRARGRPCRQRGRLSTVLDHDIYTARVVVSELVGINVD